MLTIAHITLPSHMTPSLARACGELLTSRSSLKGISAFVSLGLLYQSWEMGQPCGLGSYFIRMRTHALSKLLPDPLKALSLEAVYRNATVRDGVAQAPMLSAMNAAKNLARELEAFNIPALQVEAEALLGETLGQPVLDKNSEGRFLAAALCEQIDNWSPELKRVNGYLVGKLPEHPDAPTPVPAPAENFEQLGRPLGHIQVSGPDGVIQGRFVDPALAAEFAAQMSIQAARNAAEHREEQLALACQAEPEFDTSKPYLQVFDRQAIIERLETMSPASPMEGNQQQRKLLEQMANDSGLRHLVEVPEGDVLADMYQRFPHFAEVLDFIDQNLALAACGEEGRQVRIPPILLRGDPGVGKTFFAQELARALGTHFIERDLSVTTEAFVISGMDSSWKASKQGVVFDSLVNGKSANPLILLNEVDKAQARGTHNSPIAALYALLESTSAMRFVDEFLPVEIDASRIIWVCTANDGDIPDPVLSRLEVFDIRQPTYEECRQIAASVWSNICARQLPRGHGFPEKLPESVLDATARMSPRVMRKALTMTAGAAAKAGRKYLLGEHLAGSQKRYAPATTKNPIGFTPSN